MNFSWIQFKADVIKIKQRRARTQAKLGGTEIKLKHPAWVRDANLKSPDYTLLNKTIREEVEKKQIRNETFTRKLHENG